jgi:esterase/lipase
MRQKTIVYLYGSEGSVLLLLGFTGDDLKYHNLLKYLERHVTY